MHSTSTSATKRYAISGGCGGRGGVSEGGVVSLTGSGGGGGDNHCSMQLCCAENDHCMKHCEVYRQFQLIQVT
ncbi:hypothetical protein TYRP_001764 [Tyrophagus putrescentiae]|nr:hypothetical protein TYRP_001764 [Tyrophagus putrescentiae]